MKKIKCLNFEECGQTFVPKRKTAKFHDPKCRVAYARRNNIDMKTGVIDDVVKPPQEAPKTTGVKRDDQPAYDKEANLAAFIGMGMEKVDWISTGIPELDEFQMIPKGRITQIQGPFSVGKTTLCLNMIRGLTDKKVLYIDSEASLNPFLLVELGLDASKFHFWNKSSFLEDIYETVIDAAKSCKYEMIILDSLAGCTTKTEADGTATDRNIGQKALIVNKLFRIAPMHLKDTKTALIIINQERMVIGSYTPQKYTPGGDAPKYFASLMISLKTIPSWRFPKDAKDGEFKGHEIEVTILKSKVSRPHRKTKIKLFYVGDEPVETRETSVDVIPGEF